MAAIIPSEKVSIYKLSRLKLAYNLMNLFSGFLELGCVIFLIVAHEDIINILLAGLSYQIGNLVASTRRLSRRILLVIVFLSVFFLIIYFRTGLVLFYFINIAFVSIALQKVRRLIVSIIGSEGVSTFSKRAVRIVGFLVAGLASGFTMLIACLGVVIATYYLATQYVQSWVEFPAIHKTKGNTLSTIMVIHQSHYFSYAYLLPILFVSKLGIPYFLVGLLFILGWLSYLYSEKLFGGFDVIRIFMLGHLTVAISLVTLGLFSDSLIMVLVAWFISGLGGGTVFCLKRLNKVSYESIDLDVWEDIGHVSGVLISIISVVIFVGKLGIPFVLSASIALITAIVMFFRKGEFVK